MTNEIPRSGGINVFPLLIFQAKYAQLFLIFIITDDSFMYIT